jgi:hypothetical protein
MKSYLCTHSNCMLSLGNDDAFRNPSMRFAIQVTAPSSQGTSKKDYLVTFSIHLESCSYIGAGVQVIMDSLWKLTFFAGYLSCLLHARMLLLHSLSSVVAISAEADTK